MRNLTLLLPALVTAACALPPPETDIKLGAQMAESLEGEVGTYQDPELLGYVDTVARRVLAQVRGSPFPYRFELLDQPEPNAFAAPGGRVYVSRGLLAVAQSEDELATVLGHEITHVEHRHTIRQMSKRWVPGSILTLPGRAVGIFAKDLGDLLASPFEGLGALSMARYGRSQESESDVHGQELAAAAGYDPAALAPILDRMERLTTTLSGEQRKASYFDSHPPTPDRVENAVAHGASLRIAPRAAGSLTPDEFLERLDGLVLGQNPAQGVFRDQLYLHPDLDIAIEFPAGWKTLNTASKAGAAEPAGAAMVFYGDSRRGGHPELEQLARQRREQMTRDAGLSPTRDEARDLGGRPARLLVYTEHSKAGPVQLYFLWVAFAGRVHTLLGIAPESLRGELRRCVESLRPLTPQERASFEVLRVRIVAAEAGETIASLGARTDNHVDANVIAALNGVAADEVLPAGRRIKIARAEPYQPRAASRR